MLHSFPHPSCPALTPTCPQGALEFDALEGRLAQLESELLELNANSDRLHRSYNELLELQVRGGGAGRGVHVGMSMAAVGSAQDDWRIVIR